MGKPFCLFEETNGGILLGGGLVLLLLLLLLLRVFVAQASSANAVSKQQQCRSTDDEKPFPLPGGRWVLEQPRGNITRFGIAVVVLLQQCRMRAVPAGRYSSQRL